MQNIDLIAASGSEFNFVELSTWAGAFALVLVLVFIVVMVLRKKILQNSGSTESALTIEQLEEMHTKGMISDKEFTAMRRGVLGVEAPDENSAKSKDDI